MRFLPDLGRLGLWYLLKEHYQTYYELDQQGNRRRSWSDIQMFFGGPTVISGLVIWRGVEIRGLAEILGGMAILTALLFGLLIHVFSLGLRLADDARYTRTSPVTILIDELRANVSYACGVSLLLTVVIVFNAALSSKDSNGMNVWVSCIVAWLFVHLSLTLLMIINRVRSAYRKMAI